MAPGPGSELGEARVPVRLGLDKLDGDLNEVRGRVNGAISQIGRNIQTIGMGVLAGVGAATGAVAGLGAGLVKLAVDAAPIETVAQAFDGLAESAGTGGDEMLDALQRGSAGMIAQRDLMQSFNQAAQLVSLDFAQQLPDAMGYLGKVSAATGQDMGYLLDSLVRGVGRLSPMILDNLAIQVSLEEATARAATMFGVEAESLDKSQIQAGMMNVVMEKLAKNTAAMPDVTESAAARMAQFRARIQDTKDRIGRAMLPVLTTLLTILGRLADRFLPPVVAALEQYVIPAFEKVAGVFALFVDYLERGNDPLLSLQGALARMGFDELSRGLGQVVSWVRELIETVSPYIEMAWDWIQENIELKDVLIGLGIAVASVVIPAILPIVGAIAGVIAVFALVTGAVALVRTAWEENWGGIQEKTQAVLDAIGPAFETARAWLAEKIPLALAAVSTFWQETLQPALADLVTWFSENIPVALAAVSTFWQETLRPALEAIVLWLGENIPAAIETLVGFWEETLSPALNDLWSFLDEYVIPVVMDLSEVFGQLARIGFEGLVNVWNTTLRPALEALWGWLTDIWERLDIDLAPSVETTTGVLETMSGVVDTIKGALKRFHEWLGKIIDRLREIHIPSGLQPGSPSPLERSLAGITAEARNAAAALTALDRSLPGGGFGLGELGAGGGMTVVVVPLDRSEFTDLWGETDLVGIGEYIMRERYA